MSWIVKNVITPLVAQLEPIVVKAIGDAAAELVPKVAAAAEQAIQAEIPKVVDAVVQAVTTVGVDLSEDGINKLTDIIPGDLDNQIADAVFGRLKDLLPHFPGL